MTEFFYDLFGIYGPEFVGPTTLPYSILVGLLKLSLPAGILIAAVLLARQLLRKAPKWISCALWALVALRLICPFTIESPFSVLPNDVGSGKAVDAWMDSYVPGGYTVIYEGEAGYDTALENGRHPEWNADGNPYVITGVGVSSVPETVGNQILPYLFCGWVFGMTAMLLYAVVSCLRLKRRTAVTVPWAEGVLMCDEIDSPFILGVFRPRIYLPSRMTEPKLSRVLAHERAHLKRHDHWWKPLGFLLLSVYWFHPLVWSAYFLLCRDVEMACDQRVVHDMDTAERTDYAQTLLDCSRSRRGIAACPLAFGEVGVKERVKGVLNYKKPVFWIILIAVMVCIVLAVCLMTDPVPVKEKSVFDRIKESPAAKMELPDGSAFFVDSEISLLRTFADLRLVQAPLEPADPEEEWLYRITYNPVERVKGTDEIIVSFHKDYVQIDAESYLPESGVSYSSILAWARGKYEYFLSSNGAFTIRYELGDTAKDFISTPSVAKAGDTVELRTPILYDAGIHVYVDGQELGITDSDSGYWEYSFVMPEKDVLVTARYYTKGEVWGTEWNNGKALKEKYPAYFGLSTSQGLEVYVWQMAQGSYFCGLLPGTNREKTLEELMNLKAASIYEMRTILSTYDVGEEAVSVIPWQNPISSYIADYWISQKDEDPAVVEKRKQAYMDGIRQRLFEPGQNAASDLRDPAADIHTTAAYANWTDDSRVFADCLNAGMMGISSVPHLPVYKLDTRQDLEAFQESFRDILTLDHGYDEAPSFREIAASYDDSFFADHTVILAYEPASSGSFRYEIRDLTRKDSTLCLEVARTNNPETYTDDMAGWLMIAEVPDSYTAAITMFDAILRR